MMSTTHSKHPDRPLPAATMARITLHMARSADYPSGSATHGYTIVAPLDVNGHIDADAWLDVRDQCLVKRFWSGEPDRAGKLCHRAGGVGGATWTIDYDPTSEDDDEAGFRLATHSFVPGNYVSFRDVTGQMQTFKVERVEPIPTPS